MPETFHPIAANISGRYGNERGVVSFYAEWDEEAKVWTASSGVIKGLATEAPTLDALIEKVGSLLGDLSELP
jgi:hypothetical protein